VPREEHHDGELDPNTVRCTEELLEFWALTQWAKLGPALRLWGLTRIDPVGLDALSRLNARLHEHEQQRHREQIERLNRTRTTTPPAPAHLTTATPPRR
jgi:hypothetical protein